MAYLRKLSRATIAFAPIALGGCATVIDYAPESGSASAQVEVTSDIRMVSGKVLVHGPDICIPGGARIASVLTNISSVGVTPQQARFKATAAKPITISVPIQGAVDARMLGADMVELNKLWSHPFVSFVPNVNANYLVHFSQGAATIYNVGENGVKSPLSPSEYRVNFDCKLSTEDKGDSRFHFFLVPKTIGTATK